ncbi:MAG: esterase [Bacteroidetes bacterium QH_9_64_21]|nr:MAG: esterase [Bacteroidetes bacterium QH_9_64_21]
MSESPALHSVEVSRTARVATLGAPDTAEVWWVVLHGYGQLAADFIEAFTPIVTPDRCVVAPEGLSRFYVDGLDEHEQVGASWMTTEAREDEIADSLRFLDTTIHALSGNHPASIQLLGFSQGAATASRWALLGDTTVDRLILWGGALAHDLDLRPHAAALRTLNLTLVAGTDDQYLTPERRTAVRHRLRAHDVPLTLRTFEGGHRIDSPTLQAIADDP